MTFVIVNSVLVAGIVRQVNEDTLYPSGKILLQRLQCQQVVTVNKHVLGIPVAVGLVRVFNQNPRFQLRLDILANPGQFEFLVVVVGHL